MADSSRTEGKLTSSKASTGEMGQWLVFIYVGIGPLTSVDLLETCVRIRQLLFT